MKKTLSTWMVCVSLLAGDLEDDAWRHLSAQWSILFPPEHYTAENLHEYINGAAELFRSCDVLDAVTATFFLPPDSAHCFTVDLYRFPEPLNAFGIYARQSASGIKIALGNEATISPMSVKLWQNEYYVLLTACSPDSAVQQALIRAAAQISSALLPPVTPPEFTLLPENDRIPGSVVYYCRNYPRLSSLNHVLEARYRCKEGEKTMILVRCNNEAERHHALQQLRKIKASERLVDSGLSILAILPQDIPNPPSPE